MTQSNPSHTHIHTFLNVVKFLTLSSFPSVCFSSSSTSFPPLVSLVVGKVLIGLFPKLFLIKDKQEIHISLGDMGMSAMSQFFLQFSLCTREAPYVDEARDVSTEAELDEGGRGSASV